MRHSIDRLRSKAAFMGVAISLVVGVSVSTAHAATIQVNTTNTAVVRDQQCGIVEAVTAVNTRKAFSGCPAGTGNDTIQLQQANYVLPSGSGLTLTQSVTIKGTPSLIGNGIQPTTINGSNLTGGSMFLLDDSAGKISVTLQDIELLSGGGTGRGIQASGIGWGSNLSLIGCDIYSFNDNGIFAFAFNVTLQNTKVSFNLTNNGGGIFFVGRGSETLNVLSSTIDNNEADNGGGGIEFEGNGTFNMKNSTVAFNLSQTGGGLDLEGPSSTYTITASTIAYNTADTGGGILAPIGSDSSLSIDATILSSNTANVSAPDFDTLGSTGVVKLKNSLLGSASGAVFQDGGNNISGDPKFIRGSLGLDGNGGPYNIAVLRPDVGSPARDHIKTLTEPLDERGFPRGIGGGMATFDVGAVEMDSNTQTETLSVVSSNVENRLYTDPKFSNGKGTDIRAGKVNDFVAYSVPVPADGFYELHVGVMTGPNEGMMQVVWSDLPGFPTANCPGPASTRGGQCHTEPVGPVVDLYSAQPGYKDVSVVPYAYPYIIGVNYFKVLVTGKSHGGTGTGYQLFLDYFNLKFLMSNG